MLCGLTIIVYVSQTNFTLIRNYWEERGNHFAYTSGRKPPCTRDSAMKVCDNILLASYRKRRNVNSGRFFNFPLSYSVAVFLAVVVACRRTKGENAMRGSCCFHVERIY
jgi:hypothetical protein